MQKCQEGMKDNPELEMQQTSHNNEFKRESSIQGQPWQNGKAEDQHSYIWLSQYSAKAGDISQNDARAGARPQLTRHQCLDWQECDGGHTI